MAATVKFQGQFVQAHPFPERYTTYTSLVAGAPENLAHGGKDGAVVRSVYPIVTVPATSGDPMNFTWHKSLDSTANNTIHVIFDSVSGGDLTGMEVELHVLFMDVGTANDLVAFDS